MPPGGRRSRARRACTRRTSRAEPAEQANPARQAGTPNYFFDNSDTGPACNTDSGCFIEGNHFEEVEEPMTSSFSGPDGSIVERNNLFTGEETGEPVVGGSVENPADYYDYTVDDPAPSRTP